MAASRWLRSSKRAEQNTGLFIWGFLRGQKFPEWPGIGEFIWPDLGATSEIGRIFFSPDRVGSATLQPEGKSGQLGLTSGAPQVGVWQLLCLKESSQTSGGPCCQPE